MSLSPPGDRNESRNRQPAEPTLADLMRMMQQMQTQLLQTQLLSSVIAYFFLLDPIENNFMYWLHWKSEKNRTVPNELDELKYSKSLYQTTSYAYRHAFLYLHA